MSYVYNNGSWHGVMTNDFVYDGWNMIYEKVEKVNTQYSYGKHYVWGLDLFGSLQGAGGVGGLAAVFINGTYNPYIPLYDANGNIMAYTDLSGFVRAQFSYDAFGNVTERTDGYQQSPDLFNFRFSTKYQDFETDLNYYGYRYYKPSWGRWLNRDPIAEEGGLNLYGFVGNSAVNYIDAIGLRIYYIGGAMEHKLNYNDEMLQIEAFSIMVGADVYFSHKQKDEAITDIQNYIKSNPDENIVLIGHSWGGDKAVEIAEDLAEQGSCACITLITLDPVSRDGGPDKIPSNINEWINVHMSRSFFDRVVDIPLVGYTVRLPSFVVGAATGSGNAWATTGNQWNDQDLATANYLTEHHMNVRGMMRTQVTHLEEDRWITLSDYAKEVSRGKCED